MAEDRPGCLYLGCDSFARRRGLCDRHAGNGWFKGKRGADPQPAVRPAPTLAEQVQADGARFAESGKLGLLQRKYKEALATISRQETELRGFNVLAQSVAPMEIRPIEPGGTSEAMPVIVASDWHCEEIVGPEVGGLNRYSPEIAEVRARQFFQKALRLMRLINRDVKIHTAVLALLGDFITGNIHGEENAEKNAMMPNFAIVHAQNMLISGIDFLLNHTPYAYVVPCHSGNHARTTHTSRFGAENGHSLEYLMYLHLAAYYRNEPRLTFMIPEGMHSYLDVYGKTIRFHHGHAVKYGGGVGGIYIPVNKAIGQWNKGKVADLDVFGHFHQSRDGGNFLCNGSLIGFNAYALSIKADYEPPKQTMFVMDKKRGRTFTMPIVFSE